MTNVGRTIHTYPDILETEIFLSVSAVRPDVNGVSGSPEWSFLTTPAYRFHWGRRFGSQGPLKFPNNTGRGD